MANSFRWKKNGGAYTYVENATLPYVITGVVATDVVIVDPIGDDVQAPGTLGPSTAFFTAGVAAGTVIAAITNLASGETLSSVTPNDGRLAVSSSNLVVGLSASSAGSIAATITTSTGRTLNIAVTVNAAGSLRVATAPNYHATGFSAAVGTNRRFISRRPVYIAADSSYLVASAFNSYAAQPSNQTGNTVSILSVALEKDGGISVPVTYSAARNKDIAFNAADVQSDQIPASAFSLTKFTKGDLYWERIVYEVATSAMFYPLVAAVRSATYTGYNAYGYDPTVLPSLTADGTGALDATSKTAIANGTKTYGLVWLGFAADRSYGCVGDSFTRDNDGNVPAGAFPLGLFADIFERAMIDVDLSTTSIRPFMNCGVYGTGTNSYAAATDPRRPYYKYMTDIFDEYVENDIASMTVAAFQTSIALQWSTYKTEGVARIWRTKAAPDVTDGTNTWNSYANQTINANSQPGGKRVLVNSWFDTKAADGTLAGVIPMGRARNPANFEMKRVNDGVYQWGWTGVHPSSEAGIPMIVDEIRSIMVPNVQAVPSDIVTLLTVASDTSIRAAWAQPTNSPSDYLVEISPAGANTWTAVHTYDPALAYVWQGLSASTSYDIRVTPINCRGSANPKTATVATQAVPTGKLLDGLTAMPAQATSSRRLRAAVTNSHHVRRTIDSLEMDMPFDNNGDLDTTFLLAWTRGQDALVKRRYDQTGAGNLQTAAYVSNSVLTWPKIVVAGVLQSVNSKASELFSATRAFQIGVLANIPPANIRNVAAVVLPTSITGDHVIIGGGAGNGFELKVNVSGKLVLDKMFSTVIATSTATLLAGTSYIVSETYDGTNAALFVNKLASGTASTAVAFAGTAGTTTMGCQQNGSVNSAFLGHIPERIVWDTVPSTADRQAVENSAATYWGVAA